MWKTTLVLTGAQLPKIPKSTALPKISFPVFTTGNMVLPDTEGSWNFFKCWRLLNQESTSKWAAEEVIWKILRRFSGPERQAQKRP